MRIYMFYETTVVQNAQVELRSSTYAELRRKFVVVLAHYSQSIRILYPRENIRVNTVKLIQLATQRCTSYS